jgi:hypothetical protein
LIRHTILEVGRSKYQKKTCLGFFRPFRGIKDIRNHLFDRAMICSFSLEISNYLLTSRGDNVIADRHS